LPPVSIQVSGNNIILGWPTVAGGNYQIQYKNSLLDAAWKPLGASQPGNGNPLLLNVDTTTNVQRFYRVQLVN